tara:strand:+ start:2104 stop:2754 length:651 start_codon:yes stop_codon:yes gene_type:complete
MVCNHCGFTSTRTNDKVNRQVESQFLKISIGFSILIAASFVQVANWDSHFLGVIPLQIKSLTGSMNPSDYEKMGEICLERKKYDCVERSYQHTASQSLETRKRYADFLIKRDKIRPAAEQYRQYFVNGGVDLEATYNYAKVLAQLGQFEESTELFQQVIDAKPDTVQITVLHHYVRALIHANQLQKAKALIEEVRGKSVQANSFMAEEMAEIAERS